MVSPGCSSVSVKWQQFNPKASQPVQAPAQLHSVFSGNQLLVYGFVPHCTQATLSGVVSNQEIQRMVSTTELQKTKGTMLHKLTARAIIRDYEYGNLHTDETEHEVRKAALKSFVIDLSKEYSIVTQYTSFVAIEKRGENETTEGIDSVTTDERIAEEDVDFLPYLTWETAEDDFGESLEEELSLCSSQNVPTTDYMWIEEEEGDAVELQTSLWRDTKHHDAFVQQSFPGLEPVPQVPGGLPVPVITYQAARCLKMHSSPPPPPPPALCYSKTIPEGFTHSAVTGIGRAQNTVSAPVVFSSYSSIGGPALKMTESSYTQPLSVFGQQLSSNSSSEFSKDAFGFGSFSAFGNTSAVSAPANAAFASRSGITLGENNIFSWPASSFAFSSGRTFEQSPSDDLGLVEITHSSVSAPALVRGPAWKVTESSGDSQLFSGFGPGQLPSNSSSEFSKDTLRFGSSSAFGNASAVSAPALVRGTALEVTASSGYTQPFSGFGSGQQLPSNSSSEFSKGAFGFGSGSAFGNASAVSAPALVRGTALEVTASSGYTQPFSGFGSGQQLPSNSSSEFSKGAFGFGSGSAFGNASAVSAPALVRGTALEVTNSSGYTQPFSGFGSGQQLPSNSSSEFSKGAFGFGSGSAFGNASAVSAPPLVRGTALEVTDSSGYTQPFSGFGSGQQLPSNSSSEFSKGAFGFGSGSAFGNASAVSAPTLVRGTALEVTNSSGCTQPFSGFGSGQQFSSNSSSKFSKGALGNASAVSAPANAAFASGSGFTLGENSIFSQPASSFAFSSGRTFERSPCIDSGLVELDSSSDLCLGMSNKAVPEECSLAKSKSKKSSSLTCFKHLVCNAENTSLANESLLPPKFAPILDTAEVNQLQTKLRKGKMRHKVSAGQQSGTFPIRHLETREDLETPSRSRASLLPWTQLFDLQHQDGYWQFSPELGSLLHMDVDYFANVFLKEKGILSLGVKSSEEILRLVATMLVLQLIRYMEQLEGLIFKSLFQLDDTVHQRSEHWGSVKKAVDWVKVADWRYPSIYWRLELGRDWESTTRQLLCIDPVKQNSPLHLVCITCFKPGCFPKGGLG